MDTQLSPEALKARLMELINGSEALKTISQEERDERAALMMSASPEDMAKYIKVFEEEIKTLVQIDEDSAERLDGAKRLKEKETRDKLIEIEKKSKLEDDERAKMLLKQLDQIG